MAKLNSKAAAPKGKTESNAALTKKLLAAQSVAATASAKADLVAAQIRVKGKDIQYDWEKGGAPKVVDRKPGR
jgi:hypothetical protein